MFSRCTCRCTVGPKSTKRCVCGLTPPSVSSDWAVDRGKSSYLGGNLARSLRVMFRTMFRNFAECPRSDRPVFVGRLTTMVTGSLGFMICGGAGSRLGSRGSGSLTHGPVGLGSACPADDWVIFPSFHVGLWVRCV